MDVNLTKRQKEILIGLILGDGNLSKPGGPNANSRLRVNHGYKQLFYNKWLKREFKSLNASIDIFEPSKNTYGKTKMNRMCTKVCKELTWFYYQSYTPKKSLSKSWLQEISPLSLAIWYQDDGYKNMLNTQCFTQKDLTILKDVLKDKFKLDCNIVEYKKNNKIYYTITFTGKNHEKFNNLIKPYLLPKFYYKLYEHKVTGTIHCKYCNKKVSKNKYNQYICDSKECKRLQTNENCRKLDLKRHLSRTKNCIICNKTFHPRTSRTLTCSTGCSHKREMAMQTLHRNKINYAEILDITIENSQEEFVYDIEVADNHNYFANNFLVSNSQAISPYKARESLFPMGGGVPHGAKIIQTGVPGLLGSHFHKAYKNKFDPQTNPLGYVHHVYPYQDCPRLAMDYVLRLKNEDPDSFERNYELKWERSNYGYFTTYDEYEACEEDYDVHEQYKKAIENNWPMYWGIDFAKLRDSTVLITIAQNPENEHFYVVGDIIEFHGTEYIDQIGYIKNIYVPGHIKHTCADKSGVGEMPIEVLNDGGILTTGLNFTEQSKDKIYKNLRYQIQNKLIHWPKTLPNKEYRKFKQEFLELEIEHKVTGLISVHHNLDDNLAHDDFPTALCLALWAAAEYVEPNISFI
jgi:hypothetical protein